MQRATAYHLPLVLAVAKTIDDYRAGDHAGVLTRNTGAYREYIHIEYIYSQYDNEYFGLGAPQVLPRQFRSIFYWWVPDDTFLEPWSIGTACGFKAWTTQHGTKTV